MVAVGVALVVAVIVAVAVAAAVAVGVSVVVSVVVGVAVAVAAAPAIVYEPVLVGIANMSVPVDLCLIKLSALSKLTTSGLVVGWALTVMSKVAKRVSAPVA